MLSLIHIFDCERLANGTVIDADGDYSTEMVSPKLEYSEMGKLQDCLLYTSWPTRETALTLDIRASTAAGEESGMRSLILLSLIHI